MPYTPILATLGYVLSHDRERVLLIHRNTRPDDPALGKYNGLGGKMEADEDAAACMVRELQEEAAITVTRMTLRGTLSWPGFGKNGEHWFGFIFLITEWEGEALDGNKEGALEWKPLDDLISLRLNLWAGDRHFLPLVFDNDPAPFHGVMPYAGGQPVSWSYSRF